MAGLPDQNEPNWVKSNRLYDLDLFLVAIRLGFQWGGLKNFVHIEKIFSNIFGAEISLHTILCNISFRYRGWDFRAVKIAFKPAPVLDQRHPLLITHVAKIRIRLSSCKYFRVSFELLRGLPNPSILLVDSVDDFCIVVRYPKLYGGLSAAQILVLDEVN